MNMKNTDIYGRLVLRIALGIVLIAHSLYLKLMVFGLEGTANFFVSIGFPAFLAYAVFIVEAVTGVMLIVGFKTKVAALVTVPVLLGATWVHLPNGWLFTVENGGWEYPLFLTCIAVVIALLDPGAYSLDKSNK